MANTNASGLYRQLETGAVQLLTAWPKVQQILQGEIPIPEVVEIFPTGFCQLNCSHCRFKSGINPINQYMPTDVFLKLLDELQKIGIDTIELSGGGEPLIHPDIEILLNAIILKKFNLGIITNGIEFVDSDTLIELVSKCSMWIRFSIDAFSSDTFCKVHGKRNLEYNKLLDSIGQFVKLSKINGNPKIGLRMLISKLNVSDCAFALQTALELEVDYIQFKFLGFPNKLVLSDEEATSTWNLLSNQIADNKSCKTIAEILPPYKGELHSEKCYMTYLHPVIDYDGTIYICPFYEHRKEKHRFGNINNDGFLKSWFSDKHREVFNGIDLNTCVPNCPMLRYKPVIEFIKSDWYRFKFI